MPLNVVELLTRYPVRDRFDAREDRLTAAVVAALHQSHGLRAQLIEDLWNSSDEPRPLPATWLSSTVTGQKPVVLAGQAWFVDIELTAANAATRVWIEAKVASGLSGPDQLDKYARALAGQRGDDRLLVLLAPAVRRTELEPHLPRRRGVNVAFASWTQVHRVLSNWKSAPNSERSRRWLVNEVIEYMAAEGHRSVRKLTKGHHDALRQHETATEAVQHLFDAATSSLATIWKPIPHDPPKHARWQGWLQQLYRPYRDGPKSRASSAYQSFGFAFETFPADNATPVFGAGVYFKPLSAARQAAVAHFAQATDGTWRCEVDSAEPYLWADLPLPELLGLPTIDDQARELTAFVRRTFDLLNSRAPDVPQRA